MRKKVFVRADGNSQMGLGHVVRSLSLVEMLRDFFECTFVIRNPSLALQNQIEAIAHKLIMVPEEVAIENEVAFLNDQYLSSEDIVVLDGYHFREDYQRSVKDLGCKLVCIDDIHAYHFLADLIINHAGGIPDSLYSREAYTTMALGPEYALLRPPFLKAAQEKRSAEPIKNVFICFGGADPKNLMPSVAQAVLECKEIERVIIVAGSANKNLDKLLAWAQANERVKVYHDLSAADMIELMSACQLAVAPASTISYEVCSLGLLLYCGKYVDNQDFLYHYLISEKLALSAGDFESSFPPMTSLPSEETYASILDSQQRIFDGLSGKRIRKLFLKLALLIRDARAADAKLYFDWANEPETRLNSLNTEAIKWEDHCQWFSNRIDRQDFRFYIFEINGIPVGQVRFDIQEGIATINYSIDKCYRGIGIGSPLLELAINQLKTDFQEYIKICGIVKYANVSSAKVFRNLGFQETKHPDFIQFSLNH
ncbi:UDP-2,4-diacetamido-2,4,6-trideoxy-beta-L-altropyranose hydrolase [Dyadobacter tibetensis]|uniref:UDP-2,4-diacetamido-2,4, 6-trideoxy-beta-L-altropyranose hydrolase n=1 Tax=Dyadobacter tibetensis TaxID=1211851 RepID=UPI000470630F|nr:UDP-2,4-diacetamido-2,4,6-trideoxy-beta-L-altropyranose hydrolase [Dyadobacter tibetensis]